MRERVTDTKKDPLRKKTNLGREGSMPEGSPLGGGGGIPPLFSCLLPVCDYFNRLFLLQTSHFGTPIFSLRKIGENYSKKPILRWCVKSKWSTLFKPVKYRKNWDLTHVYWLLTGKRLNLGAHFLSHNPRCGNNPIKDLKQVYHLGNLLNINSNEKGRHPRCCFRCYSNSISSEDDLC